MSARRMFTVEDCSTFSWQIHSHNHRSAHDAKIVAARMFTTKTGVLVKKQGLDDYWAVFYWDRKEQQRASY